MNHEELSNLSNLTKETLLEYISNCLETIFACDGSGKAYVNKSIMKKYKAELNLRKINIPSDRTLRKKGLFNGKGSY